MYRLYGCGRMEFSRARAFEAREAGTRREAASPGRRGSRGVSLHQWRGRRRGAPGSRSSSWRRTRWPPSCTGRVRFGDQADGALLFAGSHIPTVDVQESARRRSCAMGRPTLHSTPRMYALLPSGLAREHPLRLLEDTARLRGRAGFPCHSGDGSPPARRHRADGELVARRPLRGSNSMHASVFALPVIGRRNQATSLLLRMGLQDAWCGERFGVSIDAAFLPGCVPAAPRTGSGTFEVRGMIWASAGGALPASESMGGGRSPGSRPRRTARMRLMVKCG